VNRGAREYDGIVRRRPLLHVLATLTATLAAAGCIAFVNDDPSSLSTTCHFQGDDTKCGACIAAACTSELNACCSDSTCSDVSLPALGACVSTTSTCGSLLTQSPALASCIASACGSCTNLATAVYGDSGPGADGGSTNCYSEGDSCNCEVGSPNGQACNAAGLKGGGLCCATYGWPSATNGSCSCQPFSCTPGSLGGNCQLGPDSSGTTTWPGPGCCSYGTFCYCEPTITCTETPVSQCDVSAIGCASDQVQVDSCSF
jgi:hypothetical protein